MSGLGVNSEQGGLLDQLGITGDGAGAVPAAPAQPLNIDQDRYDAASYRDLHKASKAMQRLTKEATTGEAPMDAFPDLVRDLYATFYKPQPVLLPANQVDPTRRINRPFVERLLEDSEVKQARSYTMLDETGSALAALATAEALLEEYRNRPELQDAIQKAQQAAKQMEQGGEPGEEGEGQPGGGGAGQQPGGPGQPDLGALQQQMQQAMDQAARQVRMATTAAAEAGQKEAETYQKAMAGWGLEPGDLETVPMQPRLDLIKRLMSPNLRRLADIVGRARNLARSRQRAKLKKTNDQVVGVEMGADISRVLASEYAKLNHPVLRRSFYKDLAEGGLLQYKLDSKEKAGRGPIQAYFDISGSMDGAPLDFAIATTMGLVDTAARQKRQALAAAFDTEVKKTWEWAPKERDASKLVDLASTGTAGGTKYEDGMAKAAAKFDESAYQKGDLVWITDGLCTVPAPFLAEFNATKKRKGFQALAVLITKDVQKPVRLSALKLEDPTGAKARQVFGQLVDWCDDGWALPLSAAAPGTAAADEFMGDVFSEVF